MLQTYGQIHNYQWKAYLTYTSLFMHIYYYYYSITNQLLYALYTLLFQVQLKGFRNQHILITDLQTILQVIICRYVHNLTP